MTLETPQLLSRRTSAASLQDIALDWAVFHPHADVLTFADGSGTPDRIATSVRCLWNEGYLFVLFAGHFERLRVMPVPAPDDLLTKTPLLWDQSDVYEAFLGTEARSSKRYFEFQCAPDGRWLDLAVTSTVTPIGDETWVSGLRCRTAVDPVEHVWRTVLALPWAIWGKGPTALEGNFYRASGAFHGDELLTWSPTGYGESCFHRPERFGRIELLQQM